MIVLLSFDERVNWRKCHTCTWWVHRPFLAFTKCVNKRTDVMQTHHSASAFIRPISAGSKIVVPAVGGIEAVKSAGGRSGKEWWCYARYGLLVILVVLLIAVLSRWSAKPSGKYSPQVAQSVRKMVKEAARWSTVSEQDSNAMLKLLHATYAVAYLNVARTMAGDKDIEALAKVRIDELMNKLKARHQKAIRHFSTLCPNAAPESQYVLHTGWI